MAARAEVRVGIVPLAETRGVWCDGCALPAAVESVIGTSVNGHPVAMQTWRWCECGHVERR